MLQQRVAICFVQYVSQATRNQVAFVVCAENGRRGDIPAGRLLKLLHQVLDAVGIARLALQKKTSAIPDPKKRSYNSSIP